MDMTKDEEKISKIVKTLISAQLAPISGSCPIVTLVQESPSCSGNNLDQNQS